MLRDYWQVTKPGIITGNLLAVTMGFFLAAGGRGQWDLLAVTLLGIALVIASACVLNNVLDRDLDRRMARTQARVLASGAMPPRVALLYAMALGAAGGALLLGRVHPLAVALVLGGFAVYVGVYTVYLKRRSAWATAVGSLAGAAPPLAGYCAVSGQLDGRAALLGLAFCLWQVPHFHAIAIRRLADYRAAAVPVWPVSHGVAAARRQMLGCIAAYLAVSQVLLGLARFGAGAAAAGHLLTAAAGLAWLYAAWRGKAGEPEWARGAGAREDWARRAFTGSLVALTALGAAIIMGALAAPGR